MCRHGYEKKKRDTPKRVCLLYYYAKLLSLWACSN